MPTPTPTPTTESRELKRTLEQQLSLQDRIHQCARQAQATLSTAIEPSRSTDSARSVRVVTSSSLHESRQRFPPNPLCFTVRVQPLLILDLNGVLCHRSRKHKEPTGVRLRPSAGNVAGTAIIPRNDILEFLNILDQYFCLAIWTSAKRKTARGLLDMLVPPSIQHRFLFVWTQGDCHAVPTDNDVIFEKLLDKAWKAFPLWNADNTLLIDDSPEKCPYAIANAIHPPPIHGQRSPPKVIDSHDTFWYPDSQNEQLQHAFFQQFIHHWHLYPRERVVNDVNDDAYREQMSNRNLYQHLSRHGTEHMGWREDKKSSWNNSFSDTAPTRRSGDMWDNRKDR
jgi:hypothetical protein